MCDNSKKKARSITMTTGSLWRNLFLFSIPLMCSQLLEVMFNLSDVAVVGRFADYRALGAVGSTTLLVTLFVGFLIGMGSGLIADPEWVNKVATGHECDIRKCISCNVGCAGNFICRISDRYGKWCQCLCCTHTWCQR